MSTFSVFNISWLLGAVWKLTNQVRSVQSNLKVAFVKVIIRCPMVAHIAEDNTIFKDAKNRVHSWLAVLVVAVVQVEGGRDAHSVGLDDGLLEAVTSVLRGRSFGSPLLRVEPECQQHVDDGGRQKAGKAVLMHPEIFSTGSETKHQEAEDLHNVAHESDLSMDSVKASNSLT